MGARDMLMKYVARSTSHYSVDGCRWRERTTNVGQLDVTIHQIPHMQQEGNTDALKGTVCELTWKVASNSPLCDQLQRVLFVCIHLSVLYYLESSSSQKFPEVSCSRFSTNLALLRLHARTCGWRSR